jgi:hypothetical protein
MRALAIRDYELLTDSPDLLRAITTAPHTPDLILADPGNLLHSTNLNSAIQEELQLKLVN